MASTVVSLTVATNRPCAVVLPARNVTDTVVCVKSPADVLPSVKLTLI